MQPFYEVLIIWAWAAGGLALATLVVIIKGGKLMASVPAEIDCYPEPPYRPDVGPCPYCQALDDEWCLPSCEAVDPFDWRG